MENRETWETPSFHLEIAYFETPNITRILEICKRYARNRDKSPGERGISAPPGGNGDKKPERKRAFRTGGYKKG